MASGGVNVPYGAYRESSVTPPKGMHYITNEDDRALMIVISAAVIANFKAEGTPAKLLEIHESDDNYGEIVRFCVFGLSKPPDKPIISRILSQCTNGVSIIENHWESSLCNKTPFSISLKGAWVITIQLNAYFKPKIEDKNSKRAEEIMKKRSGGMTKKSKKKPKLKRGLFMRIYDSLIGVTEEEIEEIAAQIKD